MTEPAARPWRSRRTAVADRRAGGTDALAEVLRAAGLRVTAQRLAILRALLEAGHHPDADSIVTAARRLDPTVHRSTVYRTLAALDRVGAVTHVHLGHGRAVYHLRGEEHFHGVCTGCGAVVHLDPGDVRRFTGAIRRRSGFIPAATQHFALSGRCATCAAVVTDGPSRPLRPAMGSWHHVEQE